MFYLMLLLAAVCCGMGWYIRHLRRSGSPKLPGDIAYESEPVERVQQQASGEKLIHPSRVVVGNSADQPVLELEMVSLPHVDLSGRPINDPAVVSRLSSLLQAVPALAAAAEMGSGQFMRVVVNGKLARAADGAGSRAFVLGPDGIQSHARLFDSSTLSTIVNAAAMWQVASVLVAQKHLVDIDKKLTTIQVRVDQILDFLHVERRSRILAAYDYLKQVAQAINGGELSGSKVDPAVKTEKHRV